MDRKEGCMVRIEGGVVKKCKSVVKMLKTVVKNEQFKFQNVALLHNCLFMDVGASPLHYLHASGTVIKAEGVDDLFRAVVCSIHTSTSSPALREKVAAEAERWLGTPLSLDLFATADNALVPLFFSRFPEPLAEEVDTLAQPDWGRSRCPHCGALHQECVFAFPPRALLPAFVAKARADGLARNSIFGKLRHWPWRWPMRRSPSFNRRRYPLVKTSQTVLGRAALPGP
jgi:hypothetical protein